MNNISRTLNVNWIVVVLLLMSSIATQAAPKGWFVAGSKPTAYESGTDDSAAHNFRPSAYLKSKDPIVHGFGTLMQEFRADHYLGKRVRFSALVRTSDAQDWAGLWMRVDKGPDMLAFDNMQDRPIKGTSNWQRYDVVLDVAPDATGIFFGILLSGTGEVWLNDAKIEIVGSDVRPTAVGVHEMHDEPMNLDFRQ